MSLKKLIERKFGKREDDILGGYGNTEFSLLYATNFWTNVAIVVEDYVNVALNPQVKPSLYSKVKSKVTKETVLSERVNEAIKCYEEFIQGFEQSIANYEKLISPSSVEKPQPEQAPNEQPVRCSEAIARYNGRAIYQLSDRLTKVKAINDLSKDFVQRLSGYKMFMDSGIELRILDNNQLMLLSRYVTGQ